VDLLQLNPQRAGGNLEDAVQGWGGGPDHAEFRRHATRVTGPQISLLHEGLAGSRDRLESFGGWESRNESSRFCA